MNISKYYIYLILIIITLISCDISQSGEDNAKKNKNNNTASTDALDQGTSTSEDQGIYEKDGIEAAYVEGNWYQDGLTIYTYDSTTIGYSFADITPGYYRLTIYAKCWSTSGSSNMKSGFDKYSIEVKAGNESIGNINIDASVKNWNCGYIDFNIPGSNIVVYLKWLNNQFGVNFQIQKITLQQINNNTESSSNSSSSPENSYSSSNENQSNVSQNNSSSNSSDSSHSSSSQLDLSENKNTDEYSENEQSEDKNINKSLMRLGIQFQSIEARWYVEGNSIYTFEKNNKVVYKFNNLEKGIYKIKIVAKNYTKGKNKNNLEPTNFKKYKLKVAVNDIIQDISIPYSINEWKKVYANFIINSDNADVSLSWINVIDEINFEIKLIKLKKINN